MAQWKGSCALILWSVVRNNDNNNNNYTIFLQDNSIGYKYSCYQEKPQLNLHLERGESLDFIKKTLCNRFMSYLDTLESYFNY